MPAKIKSELEAIATLTSRLREAARTPNINGYKPHPKQLEFHSSPTKGRAFLGGNRSGKTKGGSAEITWWAQGNHPYLATPRPPVFLRAIAVDYIQGVEKIIKPAIAQMVPPSMLKNGSWEDSYSSSLRTLTLTNGSFIEFMSYDQDLDKFAGTSRHAIWFDEEPPQSIFNENMMRLIDTDGSWWMTMTPVNGMTWIYDSIYLADIEHNDPDIKVITISSLENPYIKESALNVLTKGLKEDEKRARTHGEFVAAGGMIYKGYDETKHVYPWFPPPKDTLWVAGMDHGRTNPTCWLWASIDREGHIFIFDEYYEEGQIVSYHAKKVHEINARYGRVPDYYVGDPSIRNKDAIVGTSILIEYVSHGIPIVLGNNDQKAGLDRCVKLLDTGKLHIADKCINLRREMKRLRWATFRNRTVADDSNKKEEQHKKNDHACDALRYLVSSRPAFDDDASVIPTPNRAWDDFEASKPYSSTAAGEFVPHQSSSHSDYHMGDEY